MAISGNTVGLLRGKAAERNMTGLRLLEWLEFECGVNVDSLEQIEERDIPKILAQFEETPVEVGRR